MAHYLDLFSPLTYEAFSKSDRTVAGFEEKHKHAVENLHPGDKLICYMTKMSRWIGVLEITSQPFTDRENTIFDPENDPYVLRVKVKPLVWLEKEKTIPIKENLIWSHLSFTRDLPVGSPRYTAHIRRSLASISNEDGHFLQETLLAQAQNKISYELDERKYQKNLTTLVRTTQETLFVEIPEDNDHEEITSPGEIRESIKIQALLTKIGKKMGFEIWLPKNDRTRVLQEAQLNQHEILEKLPLNYGTATQKTIEQIDVIWLKRRSIVRAFEVEHTTAVYSGILRMADLLALQPNMDIKLHIVAPSSRREKVFSEIQRPVFSLLEKGPLSEVCTFISYENLYQPANQKLLAYMSDEVIEQYEEVIE